MIVTVVSPAVGPLTGVIVETVGAPGTNWNPVALETWPPESVTLTVTLPRACAGVLTVSLVVPVVTWAVVPGVPPKSTASVVATRLVPVIVTEM